MARSLLFQMERTLNFATRFVEEVRGDLERAARDGAMLPPRIRSVHETPGHTTPEFRTLNIPLPEGVEQLPPEALSGVIARFAARKRPDRLLLVLEAEMDGAPVLIAEARDRGTTRLFWVQPFSRTPAGVQWAEPLNGGWCDPGEQEMILDASFAGLPEARVEARRRPAAARDAEPVPAPLPA